MQKKFLLSAFLVSIAAASVWAQETPGGPDGGPPRRGPGATSAPATQSKPADARNDTVHTNGTLKPAGRAEVRYTAVAGYLPLKDETEKLRANMFFVSYSADDASATAPAATEAGVTATRPSVEVTTGPAPVGMSRRPITFLFNGGPGAASVWLHLAVGPKRLDVPEDGTPPVAPYHVVDNEYSWLASTDLVFVDPVNTGYSRAATPELAKEFFGVREDIQSVGEFIRLYLTKYQRWGSPIYLAGESYGTTRAAGLSNYLQERVGVSPSGVILISSVLNFATISPGEGNDLPFALYLPSYAAVAWYHKKLPDRPGGMDALLKDAETFASGDYASALAKGSTLSSDERTKIAKKLSELTSLPLEYVLAANLRIEPSRFEKELLRDRTGGGTGKVIGRFDGRITGTPTDTINDSQEYDPSLTGFYSAYTSAFNDYARKTLKYDNDLPYEVLSNRTQPWNFGSGANGFVYVADELRDALIHNPHMRVMFCSGRFDLATPYFATDYTIDHMTVSPDIRKNITQSYYPGGHMLYHVRPGLQKLFGEVTGFIEQGK